MLRSTAGTAATLAVALLLTGGCSRDDDKSAASSPAPAPVQVDGSAAAPGAATPPVAPDASAPAGPTDSRGLPLSSGDSPPPPPSRPAGHQFPDAGSLRIGWIDATVTKGGGGSCFGLKDADGETWSVYSKKAVPIAKGDKVRARITPGKTPVDCGDGKPATLVRLLISAK